MKCVRKRSDTPANTPITYSSVPDGDVFGAWQEQATDGLRHQKMMRAEWNACDRVARHDRARNRSGPWISTSFDIHITLHGRRDLTGQIYGQLRPGIWRDMPERMAMPMPPVDETLDCDFKDGVTDRSLFPHDAWRRCINQSRTTQAGARIAHVPVDGEGIVVGKLPRNTRLVYVTPSHQFPLGMPMSLERRIELLEWAAKRGAVIVEDDYDGEFRFEGRPVESLKSLDRAWLVAYVGTFSKTLFPDLQIGYAVPPATLAEPLWNAKQDCWHGCMPTQTALGAFMLDGDYAKHLRRMHKAYAERRATLLAHLSGALAPWFEALPSTAGIHFLAAARNIFQFFLYTGFARSMLAVRRRKACLLSYSSTTADAIERGLARLAAVMATF